MEDKNELIPHFMGGSGYFQPEPCVTVNFFAANKHGSENNKYPYFEDSDIQMAKSKAEKILKSQTEYDNLQKENALLKEFITMIENWELPETGKFWDNENTFPGLNTIKAKKTVDMKYTRNSPCKECPFLNKFKRGFTLQRLTELALTEMPCHQTCEVDEDSEDPTYEYVPTQKSVACAGAMIFLNKRKDRFIFGFDTSKLDMEADVR